MLKSPRKTIIKSRSRLRIAAGPLRMGDTLQPKAVHEKKSSLRDGGSLRVRSLSRSPCPEHAFSPFVRIGANSVKGNRPSQAPKYFSQQARGLRGRVFANLAFFFAQLIEEPAESLGHHVAADVQVLIFGERNRCVLFDQGIVLADHAVFSHRLVDYRPECSRELRRGFAFEIIGGRRVAAGRNAASIVE